MKMIPFISVMIMKAADKSLKEGQDYYRAYFVNTSLYVRYKDGVDTILQTDGYGDCIVSE